MKRLTFSFLLFRIVFYSYSYTNHTDSIPENIACVEGNLREYPVEIQEYISGDQVNLTHLRRVCHFITDVDCTHYQGLLIPKRKKAFVRHIKHLNEILEQAYLDKKPITDELAEIMFTIHWFHQSFIEKIKDYNAPLVTRRDKISILYNTIVSPKHLKVKVTDDTLVDFTPINRHFIYLDSNGTTDSHYFDELARLKKVNTRKNMVVLFDGPSLSGSAPKVDVLDLDLENKWVLKWGDEVHTDVAGSRIFAALGYDVDHPYFYGEERLTLVFDRLTTVSNADELIAKIKEVYRIDVAPFISSYGLVSQEMVDSITRLQPFLNKPYVRFKNCSIEARPDRVKRIGAFILPQVDLTDRRELNGALLAHQFIGNWDIRSENTRLTQVHMGNYQYRTSAVFCDLGTSFGVNQHFIPLDFKVGLVNEFGRSQLGKERL